METKFTNIKYQLTILLCLIVIVFLLFRGCGPGENLKTAENLQKKKQTEAVAKIKKLVDKVNEYQKQKSKLDLQNFELEKKIIDLETKNNDLQKLINYQVNKVKLFTRSEIANYFADRYKLENEVKTTENGTELTDTIARLSISDFIIGDGAKKEVFILKEVLKIKDSTIFNDKKIIGITDFQSKLKDSVIIQKDNVIYSLIDLNKTFKTAVKKEKNKTLLWKFISGAILFLSGVIMLK